MATSPNTQRAIDEILGEIQFQKVLLDSLDGAIDNVEEAELEIKTEISSLKRKLRGLNKHRATPTSTSSQPAGSQLSLRASSPPSSTQDNMQKQPGRTQQGSNLPNGNNSTSSTASTPNSTMDSLHSTTSPFVDLPSRKRSHSKHLDGLAPVAESKSRRTSPSPYMTGVTTPASFSEDTSEDDFPALNEDFFRQQQIKEVERIARERADEKYARNIQEGRLLPSTVVSSSKAPSQSFNAFDRISGMRPPQSSSSQNLSQAPNYSTSTGRKLPWPSSSIGVKSTSLKPEPSSALSGFSDVGMAGSAGSPSSFKRDSNISYTDIKAETKQQKPKSGFIDVDGLSSTTDDSDIEVIDATDFQDNGRYKQPSKTATNTYGNPFQSVTRPALNAGNAALHRMDQSPGGALQRAMYGNAPQPAWMNGGSQTSPLAYTGNVYNNEQSAYGNMNAPRMETPRRNPFTGPNNGSGFGGMGMPGAFPDGDSMQTPDFDLGYGNFPIYNNHLSYLYGDEDLGDYQDNQIRPGYMNAAMADQFDYIMNDPRKTQEEIKDLLENIRPDVDLPREDREGTPEGLRYGLYEHQKIALTWLKGMEESKHKGGILADDMGLGKTISSLALILSRPSTNLDRKTTLIVGPVALVRQWEREIKSKVKREHRLSTHMVHGPQKKRSWDELKNFDIVLTTYGTLGAEYKRYEKFITENRAGGRHLDHDIDPNPLKKQFPLLGPKSLFYRVILDEAQCIKNKNTVSAKATWHLKSLTRLCLTGTPMMNNIAELYPLIHFLQIRPYNDFTQFRDAFGMLTKGDSSKGDVQKGMLQLQAFLKAIMLRRVKGSLIDGKPIIVLPPKTEEIQHVVFNEDEQSFYQALETKTQVQFNKYMRAGTVGKNYSNILVLLLRLRQCCCHPHLITHFDTESTAVSELSADTLVEIAKSLAPDVVTRLTEANGNFECPVCYDAVINPTIVIPCGHDTCSECLAQIVESQAQQSVAAGAEGPAGVKCPQCRGKIEMNKVIDYNTFKKVHMPIDETVIAAEEETASESDSDDSDTDSDSEGESGSEADSNGDLRDFIVPDADADDSETEDEDPISDGDGDDEAEVLPKKTAKLKGKKKESKRRSNVKDIKDKGKAKAKTKKPTVSIAILKKEAARSAKGRKRYLKFLKKHWQPSAKVTKCIELLDKFQQDGKKTIVFSQFVSLLDLLQVPIDEKNWVCERYDGSMNAEKRNDAIIRFTDRKDTNIMLISLKAGNAGLNLVGASRVIILDPFWNPYIEMQAVDRAYRIGQRNPVEVHRILIEQTVEDRIIELQEQKKKLVEAALDEGASKSISHLGNQELAFLFGVGGP